MSTEIHHNTTTISSGVPRVDRPVWPFRGRGSWFLGPLAYVKAAFWKVFAVMTKGRRVPVVHQDVMLTKEGAEVWEQIADPQSSVGKPIRHRRRRVADGDAAG
jgi:hypothetical protein